MAQKNLGCYWRGANGYCESISTIIVLYTTTTLCISLYVTMYKFFSRIQKYIWNQLLFFERPNINKKKVDNILSDYNSSD